MVMFSLLILGAWILILGFTVTAERNLLLGFGSVLMLSAAVLQRLISRLTQPS